MRRFWKIFGTATFLSAVAVAVLVTPKRPAPKPELVTIEFYIGERKFTVTGEVVDRFDPPQTVNRIIKADAEVH